MAVTLGDAGMASEWGPVAIEDYNEQGGDFTIEEAQHAQMTMAFVQLAGGRDAEPEEAARIARGVLSASPEGPTHTVAARLRQCAGAFVPAQRSLPEVAAFIEECTPVSTPAPSPDATERMPPRRVFNGFLAIRCLGRRAWCGHDVRGLPSYQVIGSS